MIDANQAGNANYNAAPQVQQSFAVGKGDQTISFTSTAPVAAAVGGPTYTVTATATSGLPVTFTIDATASSVCSIAGSTVSFLGAGTCVIDANQAGNANYNAAPQVQQSFQVNQRLRSRAQTTTSFTSGKARTFTVTTTGVPTGASMGICPTGTVPSGVTSSNNNNGTATMAGTPAARTQNSALPVMITANNGIPPNATQNFTLTVLNLVPQIVASPKESFDTVGNTQLQVAAVANLGGHPLSIRHRQSEGQLHGPRRTEPVDRGADRGRHHQPMAARWICSPTASSSSRRRPAIPRPPIPSRTRSPMAWPPRRRVR